MDVDIRFILFFYFVAPQMSTSVSQILEADFDIYFTEKQKKMKQMSTFVLQIPEADFDIRFTKKQKKITKRM